VKNSNEATAAAGFEPAALVPNGACSSCGRPIRWVKTARGKNLPLNPEPSTSPHAGNFGLSHDEVAHYVRDSARRLAFHADGTSEFPIYVAHFATCARG
jgi:hypothetical protein